MGTRVHEHPGPVSGQHLDDIAGLSLLYVLESDLENFKEGATKFKALGSTGPEI